MTKTFSLIIIIFFPLIFFSQKLVFRGYTIEVGTHDTIPNVKLSLIDWDNDTIETVSDIHGYFSLTAYKVTKYNLVASGKTYRHDKLFLYPIDTAKIITYLLSEPETGDYFQEFLFEFNSAIPKDTSLFYAWDLHKYNLDKKIVLTGFYSPSENPEIARKRASAILQGFIKRGADAKKFKINTLPAYETTLRYGHYVEYNKESHFFKKGLIINKDYINTLKADRKEAAKQLLQAVRIDWYRK